jgi:hypothetical protein
MKKKDSITLNGESYDLIRTDSSKFVLEGIKLPPPFIELPSDFRTGTVYKCLIINGSFYGVIPQPQRKVISLNDLLLRINFDWVFQFIEGSDRVYHKGFTGDRWFQLRFVPDNNEFVISVKRVRKGSVEEQILFNGEINDIDDFEYICGILKID